MKTNLDGFYNVLHPLVMPMIRAGRKGRIVTLSSVSDLLSNRGQVNYSAAKAGIIGYAYISRPRGSGMGRFNS